MLAEDVIGPHAKHRRMVDEYVRSDLTGQTDAVEEDGAPSSLPYALARRGVEFGEFIRGEGYNIAPSQ